MSVVEMQGITKRFASVLASDHIDLDVESNEIHALLGENGAGKTTLMKILYGLYQPDEGSVSIKGTAVQLKSPADAIARGVGFVSQHFSLVPTLTVAENIVLGYEGGRLVQRDAIVDKVAETAKRYGFQLDPNALVGDLAVGQQQRVEILKALYRDCQILILDEPTAVLPPQDAAGLFDILRELQQKHLSVVIIMHKLEEVMAISQRVTVLRQGRVVGRKQTADTSPAELANLMVGRDTVVVARNTAHHPGQAVALQADNLKMTDGRGVPVLRGVSFKVHVGEVVGIAGVAGNGQSELVAILNGTLKPDSGRVLADGQPMKPGDPREFNRAKIGRIPEDRLKGVIGDLTVAQNLALEQIEDYSSAGHLKRAQIQERAERLIREYQIKAKPDDRTCTLSGGNIQKIILARALAQQPKLIIAAQPTRGLDVGATEYIHQKLLEQKERGAGVLLVSEDLDEVMILSDRILVIYEGQIVGQLQTASASIDEIGLLMAGSAVKN
jgi:simple sugar transport system ATP-binding protein